MTIEEIQKSGILSPGLVDGSVMTFLATVKNGYYLRSVDEQSWKKDKDGKLLTIPLASVLHARQEYLNMHQAAEIANAIQLEITKLGTALVEKASELIDFITLQEGWVTEDKTKGQSLLHEIIRQNDPAIVNRHVAGAEQFFQQNPTAIEFRDKLKKHVEDLDYEALYRALNEDQQPIGVFGHNSPALLRVFGRLALDDTLTDLQESGPLYLKAKINVEKRYFS